MNESDLSENAREFLKAIRILEGKDYDTRAKVIQNIRTGMAQTPDVEALTAMLSSYLKTAN
jgi:hypothetical protein